MQQDMVNVLGASVSRLPFFFLGTVHSRHPDPKIGDNVPSDTAVFGGCGSDGVLMTFRCR